MEAWKAFLAAATWDRGRPCDESTAVTCGFGQRAEDVRLEGLLEAARREWKVGFHSRCRFCLRWDGRGISVYSEHNDAIGHVQSHLMLYYMLSSTMFWTRANDSGDPLVKCRRLRGIPLPSSHDPLRPWSAPTSPTFRSTNEQRRSDGQFREATAHALIFCFLQDQWIAHSTVVA